MNLAAQQTAARVHVARGMGLVARRHRVPRARPPTLIEADYAAALVSLVAGWRRVAEPLLAALPALLRTDSLRLDDDPIAGARRTVDRVRAAMDDAWNPTQLEGIAERAGKATSAQQRGELGRQAKAALGIDVMTIDPKVPQIIRGFAAENVALIKSLQGRTLDAVEGLVIRAVTGGTRAEVVAKELQARFDVSERHARLIARDQIGKLSGQIAAARHQELGIVSFVWRTVRDERVRKRHVALEGKTFRYDTPPSEGLPGQPILCRCTGEPVFDDLAELAAEPGRSAPAPAAVPTPSRPAVLTSAPAPIAHAEIVSLEPVSLGASGINASSIARLADGRRALWKPASGETSGLRSNIKAGTYYRREAAAAQVAEHLGVADMVPPTATRRHGGTNGSLQEWREGAQTLKPAVRFDRDTSERMRVFDYVTGNSDRHYGNVLSQVNAGGSTGAVLIDHGLAFPIGPPQVFMQPVHNLTLRDPQGNVLVGLLDSTRAQIKAINLRKLAGQLARAGIEPEAVRHTLYRARLLQLQPEFIEVPAEISGSRTWDAIVDAEPRLPAAELRKIDKMIAEAKP